MYCSGFKAWCKGKGIRPRFDALGKYGSIAVIERFLRTLKEECTRRVTVPLRRTDMRRELTCHLDWYNQHRPHDYLGGRTPNEAYHNRLTANEAPRIEVRPHWPPGASYAAPAAAIDGEPGQNVEFLVSHHAGRKYLPVIQLRRVA
ncbi:MAG: integrase core domain-containing protein [Phycisphaerae bacterium]